jgi:hypothetical protein
MCREVISNMTSTKGKRYLRDNRINEITELESIPPPVGKPGLFSSGFTEKSWNTAYPVRGEFSSENDPGHISEMIKMARELEITEKSGTMRDKTSLFDGTPEGSGAWEDPFMEPEPEAGFHMEAPSQKSVVDSDTVDDWEDDFHEDEKKEVTVEAAKQSDSDTVDDWEDDFEGNDAFEGDDPHEQEKKEVTVEAAKQAEKDAAKATVSAKKTGEKATKKKKKKKKKGTQGDQRDGGRTHRTFRRKKKNKSRKKTRKKERKTKKKTKKR